MTSTNELVDFLRHFATSIWGHSELPNFSMERMQEASTRLTELSSLAEGQAARIAALEARCKELQEYVLKKHQFEFNGLNPYATCDLCGRKQLYGHEPSCRKMKMLAPIVEGEKG